MINDPVNYVDLWGLCKSESDEDNKGFFSWLIPDPDEMTETEAQAWIDKFVCSNKFFPICAEMYTKSRNVRYKCYILNKHKNKK